MCELCLDCHSNFVSNSIEIGADEKKSWGISRCAEERKKRKRWEEKRKMKSRKSLFEWWKNVPVTAQAYCDAIADQKIGEFRESKDDVKQVKKKRTKTGFSSLVWILCGARGATSQTQSPLMSAKEVQHPMEWEEIRVCCAWTHIQALTDLILFVIECHSALLLRRWHSLVCFILRGRRKASFPAGMINWHSKCNEIESSDTDPLSASLYHALLLL